jgi:4-hydroxyacetophenone monooxygenase
MTETALAEPPARPAAVDEAFLRRMVEQDDVNVLRTALYQQTGDPELARMTVLKETREGSPFEVSTLDPRYHQAVKDKAVAFLRDNLGRPNVIPTREEAGRMMEMFVGAKLTEEDFEYGWGELAFDGFPRAAAWSKGDKPEAAKDYSALIIGAGITGLLAAIQFDKLGLDYRIIERQADIGGTWHLNHYPEARVDVTTFLYQFKFEGDYRWRDHFATQAELQEYHNYLVDKYDLRRRISLNTKVEAARWDEPRKAWIVDIEGPDGARTIEANFIVSASGQFSTPKMPDIRGIENFAGEIFHSTAWNHDFDLTGKRVAVIGTGSTGIQMARGIAAKAKSLTVYQRSPKWLTKIHNYRHPVSEELQWLFDNMPAYREWYRYSHHASQQIDAFHDLDREWQAKGGKINEKNDLLRANLTRFIEKKVSSKPELLPHLVPEYAPLARRFIVDNSWYDTLVLDHVELVPGPIERFTRTGIVSPDGVEREFDLVVLAAGFEVTKYLHPVDYEGRDGTRLNDLWSKDGARAYLTMALPGFPNFVMTYGPNHGTLAGSFHSWAECLSAYYCRLITQTIESGAHAFEVKREAYDRYNRELDAGLAMKLWQEEAHHAGGYHVNSYGRAAVNHCWTLQEYQRLVREPDFNDFELR